VVGANPGTTNTNQYGNANSTGYCSRLTAPANTTQNSFWACSPSAKTTSTTGGASALNIGNSPYTAWAYIDSTTPTNGSAVDGTPSAKPVYISASASTGSPGTFWSFGPSSYHSGGVVLHLYGDGSVKNVTDDADSTIYVQLISRAGSEPAIPFGQDGA
jgi:hypothetical protein